MAAEPAHLTLLDVLRCISEEADQTLFRNLIVRYDSQFFPCSPDLRGLAAARATCKQLQQIVDSHVSELELRLHHFNDAQLAEFCSNGLWLNRWPHCTKIGLDVGPDTEAQLYIPFATMPLKARQRITELEISCAGDESLAAISNAEQFRNLLQSLPSLTALQLLALPPPGPEAFWPASVRQLPPILDSLKQLKSLTVGSLEWVESYLLGDALAGQLTRLEVVNGEEPLYDMLEPPESDRARHPSLPSCVRSMRCLQELKLDVGVRDSFAPDDVGPMVAALPPSVKTFEMTPVGTRDQTYFCVSCALDGSGGLTSFELSITGWLEAVPTSYWLSNFLGKALLPRLGPTGARLRRLAVLLRVKKSPRQPDPAHAVRRRCDEVEMPCRLEECAGEDENEDDEVGYD